MLLVAYAELTQSFSQETKFPKWSISLYPNWMTKISENGTTLLLKYSQVKLKKKPEVKNIESWNINHDP